MLGYTEEELQRLTVLEVSHEEDRSATEAILVESAGGPATKLPHRETLPTQGRQCNLGRRQQYPGPGDRKRAGFFRDRRRRHH